ncbi:MAG: 2-hydroxyacyl-CoA dehydratase family protein [Actinobacteria bacterium]|nr:2-hydroxyacyl-CoA dehydratase family protein [Actinomycetota bacterium]
MNLGYLFGYQLAGRAGLRLQRWRSEWRHARTAPDPDRALNPPLRSTIRMREMMSLHYLEGRHVAGVRPVAWVTSGAPTEILKSMGYFLVYPENHAALCGARRHAEGLAVAAESAGYSRDICSYARTDLGSVLSGTTPVGSLPPPDLLLCSTNICQTVLYWYRVLADHFGCPLVLVDTPFLYEDEAAPHQVDFVRRQLEEIVPIAERVARREFSEEELGRVIGRAKRASDLWLEILNRARHRPAPMTAFDGFINLGPIVDLRGDRQTVEFYEGMLAELDERIDRGIGAVRHERYRVLWDNLPIWYRIGPFSRWLAERGVNIVASTYTHAWGELAEMMDADRPFEAMARVYLHPILNRSTGHKLAAMRRMVEDFEIDGVILHSDRSCKPYSLGQIDQRDRLVNQVGIPALLLEADHNDPRSFAEEQAMVRMEAFVEMMSA